ncbi:sialate O-acetylesterase [Emticicia sp. SJ17W-69]|uniref:sialate O-acetylesterase n=1 Tax=Emticicia sp. SJ17W-69 TaxID=3421657 RepID=UPI003EBEDFC8
MKKKHLLSFLLLLFSSGAWAQNCDTGYDIILVAGQSNTHYGYPLIPAKDTVSTKVYALKRYDGKDYRIDKASPALDFWTKATNRNSFAITFANLYVKNILSNSGRKILIIPCGYAGTAIASWIKGTALYNDAIDRTNYVLNNIPGSKVVAILWHQGEYDAGPTSGYQATLDKLISNMRNDIKQANPTQLKFILGGFVPFWANAYPSRIATNTIIKNTPNRITYTGFADPTLPFVISKPNNYLDDIHFDSDGQREMGKRYYNEFVRLNNPSARTTDTNSQTSDDNVEETDIQYYPNPTNGLVRLESKEIIKSIEVYSSLLKKVLEVQPTEKIFTLDLRHLQPDTYFIRLTTKIDKLNKFTIIKE